MSVFRKSNSIFAIEKIAQEVNRDMKNILGWHVGTIHHHILFTCFLSYLVQTPRVIFQFKWHIWHEVLNELPGTSAPSNNKTRGCSVSNIMRLTLSPILMKCSYPLLFIYRHVPGLGTNPDKQNTLEGENRDRRT